MSTRTWYTGTYLLSDHWKELRLVKMDDVGHKCEVCRRRYGLEVHHRAYRPYKERLSDLQVLCDECHARHHEAEMSAKYEKASPKNPQRNAKPSPEIVRLCNEIERATSFLQKNRERLTKPQIKALNRLIEGQRGQIRNLNKNKPSR